MLKKETLLKIKQHGWEESNYKSSSKFSKRKVFFISLTYSSFLPNFRFMLILEFHVKFEIVLFLFHTF